MTSEQKVKHVYPDAYAWDFGSVIGKAPLFYIEENEKVDCRELGHGTTESEAWESAAENIPDLRLVKP